MNRSKAIVAVLTMALAALAAGVLAFGSGAAAPAKTATVDVLNFAPGNHVVWGYYSSGTYTQLGDSQVTPTATSFQVPYSGHATLVLYIKDISCGNVVYFSDGTSFNPAGIDHATITRNGHSSYVDIVDGGIASACALKTSTQTPAQGGGTLQAEVTPGGALSK